LALHNCPDFVTGLRKTERINEENEILEQSTVLIVSDHVEFAHAITGRWQSQPDVPMMTMMSTDLCQEMRSGTFDLAIIGAVRNDVLAATLVALEGSAKSVVHVCENAPNEDALSTQSRVMRLRKQDGWLDVLILLGSETLRKCEAIAQGRRVEQANALLEAEATLGRYILEMRHSLNNALTSILGNSELILLEEETLSPAASSQIETIRNMGLRMHEVLQRFSSLEKELKVAEKQAQTETIAKAQAAGAIF
jgi:signal transduction histidine kinase